MADAGVKVLRGLLDVFILESLERGPKHGYALLREMADAFGTEPNRNRLYPLLGRMVQDGLVAERNEAAGARTIYALTDPGREALAGYRRLPASFHERIARVWGVAGPGQGQAQGQGHAQQGPAQGLAQAPVAARVVPVTAPGELPYPCPDARVAVERAPRTGDISVRLTGCPMGAYDYCPLCPVAKSVEGLRKLTFL